MSAVKNIFWQFLMLVLCTGSVASVLLGLGMLLKPERVARLSRYLSRWITPAQNVSEQLDRPHWIERYFYRHHRLVGGVLFAGAIFILYVFLFSFNMQKIAGSIPRGYMPIANALVALLLIGSVLAALVGIIVLLRPSLLRDIETTTNRWISTEPTVEKLNNMHHMVDDFVMRHRRVAGVIMVVGGLYILGALLPIVWHAQLRF